MLHPLQNPSAALQVLAIYTKQRAYLQGGNRMWDWILVYMVVFFFVFLFQYMVTFFDPPKKENTIKEQEGEKQKGGV